MSDKNGDQKVDVHEDFYGEMITPQSIQKCELLIEGKKPDNFAYQLHTISPFGCQIGAFGMNASMLTCNQLVTVLLIHPGHISKCEGIVVHIKETNSANRTHLISIKWFIENKARESGEDERRGAQRFVCSEEFRPTGVLKNPFKFNDYIFFQVIEVSESGLKIRTSLRNRFLTPNLILRSVNISFPTLNQITVDIKLLEASVVNEKAIWRCKFEKKSRSSSQIIGQYLLQFSGSATAKSLKKQGLRVSSVTHSISFEWVRTKEDYQKVLELRKRAWLATGKVKDDVQPEFFADEFDSRAKILFGSHHDKAVASMRFVYTDQNQQLEHSKYFKGGWPKGMPPLEESIELTRVVTDPEYREQDLLYSMFQQTAVSMSQSDKRYFIGNADVSLHKIYKLIGCKFIGEQFEIPHLKVNAQMLVGDYRNQVLGVNVNPMVWNLLFSELHDFCVESGLIQPSLKERLRIARYKLIKPASWLLSKQMNKSRKKPKK